MADAILSVPIYDSQYKTISELCLVAKKVYQFSSDNYGNSHILNLDESFNIGLFTNFAYSYYGNLVSMYPAIIILPNSTAYLMTKYATADYDGAFRIVSTAQSIQILDGATTAKFSFIFAALV